MRARVLRLIALIVVTVASCAATSLRAKTLGIAPVYQQTPAWCWAAVGEMVFRYYRVPSINPVGNFQCGIVALLHPVCNVNCMNCPVPAGSMETMDNMLTRYPEVARRQRGLNLEISTAMDRSPLSLEDIVSEIDAGRPIVAGISPSGYRHAGISEHVALIVGYEDDALVVNDPFPFQSAFTGDPYLAAGGQRVARGRYLIAYDAFVERLQWEESIYEIECAGEDCGSGRRRGGGEERDPRREYGRSCRTPAGQCGPFYNQPALPLGSSCYCATPVGPMSGQVVTP